MHTSFIRGRPRALDGAAALEGGTE
jgi:hypothetical protein